MRAQVGAKQMVGSRERDFFRWTRVPLTIYRTKVPVKTDASKSSSFDTRGTADIAMVLPSDHLQALHDQGPEVFCQNKFRCFSNLHLGEINMFEMPVALR